MTQISNQERAVIVGASHAGAQLAVSLRQYGWTGEIVLIGEEPWLPYHRPPLSKGFLNGSKNADDLLIRKRDAYEKADIDIRVGERVVALDRDAKTVETAGGEIVGYSKLALCLGAAVRTLPIPGAELHGVHYLRTLADVERIRKLASEAQSAVIIGGGYIGLETAASLRHLGLKVTILELGERVLARVTAPELSHFYTRVHREEGVAIHTGMAVTALSGTDRVDGVFCSDGSRIDADLVIAGIGVDPVTDLALHAGLDVRNGIVVDSCCVTSDPDIVAAGDCAQQDSPLYGWVRLESVANATEQAKSAAAAMCQKREPTVALPWFWSDQYDIKLQIAGLNAGYDRLVVRGDLDDGRSFAAFYLKGDVPLAVDCVNRPIEFMLSKKLIAKKTKVDPISLADETIAFKELVAGWQADKV